MRKGGKREEPTTRERIPVSIFLQAEDGIRDGTVTGVQTCALPIYRGLSVAICVNPSRYSYTGTMYYGGGSQVAMVNIPRTMSLQTSSFSVPDAYFLAVDRVCWHTLSRTAISRALHAHSDSAHSAQSKGTTTTNGSGEGTAG